MGDEISARFVIAVEDINGAWAALQPVRERSVGSVCHWHALTGGLYGTMCHTLYSGWNSSDAPLSASTTRWAFSLDMQLTWCRQILHMWMGTRIRSVGSLGAFLAFERILCIAACFWN